MTEQERPIKSWVDPPSLALFLTGVGLIVTVATLDRAAGWKAAALVAGASAVALIVIGARWVQWRMLAAGAAGACLVACALLLVVAPAPAEPEPQAELVVSKFDALAPEGGSPPRFDITPHNIGNRGAVLNELVVETTDFTYLPWCMGASSISASKPYPLTMPDDPKAGAKATVTLHEEVPAGRVDRMLINISGPPYRMNEDGQPIPAVFVYLAEVTVTTDVTDPVLLGTVAFSTPYLPTTNTVVWDLSDPARHKDKRLEDFIAADPSVPQCLDRNSAALGALLDRPADVTQDGLAPQGSD